MDIKNMPIDNSKPMKEAVLAYVKGAEVLDNIIELIDTIPDSIYENRYKVCDFTEQGIIQRLNDIKTMVEEWENKYPFDKSRFC